MPDAQPSFAELDHYREARAALTATQQQLDDDLLRHHGATASSPGDIEALVATLCQEAKAARHIAALAESLCEALVAAAKREKVAMRSLTRRALGEPNRA